ncbi:hypothetical protein ACA870_002752 [Vibrio vulnificus]
MKIKTALACLFLSGCVSNSADTAVPAPTNLVGIYKAVIMGGSITWEIFSDGTGVACEQRTDMNQDTKLRDLVINGNKAYDVFEFTITDVSDSGFQAVGIIDLEFNKLKKLPVSCRYKN